ncbi:alpha-hydroxyacid dehydrogenase, FMN-dependent L-lactate dehydrogenase [Burkholderiales bacterium JOSHI_001]|nr:alpha-hydroxyacid dehydrogenase, FMN-dependent L-lactate dehydrogenase [Burkholderiales bacterium JOSHI_001]
MGIDMRMPTPLEARAINLADYKALAHQVLSEEAWAYFAGGAADEITLRANRQAWDALRLWPRVLRPLQDGHTRVALLGRTLAHPILLAPVAYQCLAHADGELATAAAAAALQAGMVLSAQASVTMEQVAKVVLGEAQHGPLWFQLYVQADRGFTRELVQRTQAAGYEAIVLTVDAPVHGARDRERRAAFQLPPGVQAVNLVGARPAPRQAGLAGGVAGQAATWHDLAWLREATNLPLLVKGVLHPDDAQRALALGADGLIVSNHGGRTLDTAPASAQVLPRIVDAVGPGVPLLVDGGIRRGTDVLKAIALGADAVLVGRPQVFALAAAGAHGVAHMLRLLCDELEIAMAQCGCATLDQADRRLIFS